MIDLSPLSEHALGLDEASWNSHLNQLRLYWGHRVGPILVQAGRLRLVRRGFFRWLMEHRNGRLSETARVDGERRYQALLTVRDHLGRVIAEWPPREVAQAWRQELEGVMEALTRRWAEIQAARPARPAPRPVGEAHAGVTLLAHACAGEPRHTGEMLSLLGLPPNYGWTQLKSKYRDLARRYHPDTGGNATCMTAINASYSHLGDKLRLG